MEANANPQSTHNSRFQWNMSGWFGASLGSSAWMLLSAAMLAGYEPASLAWLPLVGFLVVAILAYFLWRERSHISAYRGLMTLFAVVALIIPLLLGAMGLYASPAVLAAMNWPRNSWLPVLSCGVVPAMMVWFSYLEFCRPLQSPAANDEINHGDSL